MKQLLQSLNDGSTELVDVPIPKARDGEVLIDTAMTLVSAGTERMLVEFGKGNLLQKARSQPDKVRMALQKARTDGIPATLEAVRSKLDQPLALGYCNVGQVRESAGNLPVGTRVVSNGRHAGVVAVPRNLVAPIPDTVSDEMAVFTVLASIGLQGIRLVQPTLGEVVAVTGLGLIGLLTVQLLRAQGCRVLGIDPDPERCALAERFGAVAVAPGEAAGREAERLSRGYGIDAVLVTASTSSSAPVAEAARMCRKRGRIVLVGVTGLELSRADFYEKELSFQVSCSYGPGRYDPSYEEGGQDYPIGFVRWTQGRNFEAILDLMAAGAIDVAPLISHRFSAEEGAEAMNLLASNSPSMGILLTFGAAENQAVHRVPLSATVSSSRSPRVRVAVLGAGNYASRVLIPALASSGAELRTLVSAGGVSAVHHGRRQGFAEAATDESAAFDDPEVDAIVIATRHDAHAGQVLRAIEAGKHVFCEKPLCLSEDELDDIAVAARASDRLVMVGFNRRFAPQVVRMRGLLADLNRPAHMTLTMNAGEIPADHWVQDPVHGGGRIVGEACHLIDLARYLADSPVSSMQAVALGDEPGAPPLSDCATIVLTFDSGSVAVVNYLANGPRQLPKERVEIVSGGRALQLENFLTLKGFGWPGFSKQRSWKQDKGAEQCMFAFVSAVKDGTASPIALDEIIEVSRLSIRARDMLVAG